MMNALSPFFKFYGASAEMLERFENIPDMLELDHLTVSGDVTFGKNVTLKVDFKHTTSLLDNVIHSYTLSDVLCMVLLFSYMPL